MERINRTEYIVGMTGIGCSVYGIRLVMELLSRGYYVRLILSDRNQQGDFEGSGQPVNQWLEDTEKRYPGQLIVEDNYDLEADIGRESYVCEGMIIVPCSMSVLAQMAHGVTETLILACGEICMKKHRKLVVVPQETPFTQYHLENMLALAKQGVQIVPAMPAFRQSPCSLEEMIDYMVGTILDGLDIPNTLWKK